MYFVSFADFLVRGLFLPFAGVFAIYGIVKTHREMKEILENESFEENEEEVDVDSGECIPVNFENEKRKGA